MASITLNADVKCTKKEDALATRVLGVAFVYGGNKFQKMMERADVKALFDKGILTYEKQAQSWDELMMDLNLTED